MTEEQVIICAWVHDLTIRIRRAQLRAEVIGLDEAELDQLEHERDEILRLCKVLDGLRRAA
jgi:hypothetical protein